MIEKEALFLPDAERALLADRLIESLSCTPPELKASWIRESSERMDAFHRGEIEAVDGPSAIAELKKRFG